MTTLEEMFGLPPEMEWHHRAACSVVDMQTFTEPGNEVAAKRICASCPVRSECLEYARRTGQIFDVWGGLTPEEREALSGSNGRSTA